MKKAKASPYPVMSVSPLTDFQLEPQALTLLSRDSGSPRATAFPLRARPDSPEGGRPTERRTASPPHLSSHLLSLHELTAS